MTAIGATGLLYLPGRSAVHRLAPEAKIVAMVAVTVVIVLTPPRHVWAFAAYLGLLLAVAAVVRARPRWLLRRSVIELPFVAFALLLPLLGSGERMHWHGVSLSATGLVDGWNILAKGSLGVLASLLLAASTSARELIIGLDRLRCPQPIVAIATFMLRYVDLLLDQANRMRVARLSRGYDPRFLWQVGAFAKGIAMLFLRAFERGERVYLAMISRGYGGRLPTPTDVEPAGPAQWAAAAILPVAAAVIAVIATGVPW